MYFLTPSRHLEQDMTRRSRKALIIGAGIAGPVTAILLRRAGYETQLFEAWPHASGIGGGLILRSWAMPISYATIPSSE